MNNHYTITPEEHGKRLDIVLTERFPEQSRSFWQKQIEQGRVLLKEKACKPKIVVQAGDSFSTDLLDPNRPLSLSNTPLPIIYEDDELLVINKPAGMVVHPNNRDEEGTVVQSVLHMRPGIAEAIYDPDQEISRLRPGIVHRLDKDTSGVLVVAKTSEVLQNLANQFHAHTVQKEYLALLAGKLTEPRLITTNLVRKTGKENLMGVSRDPAEGREAITQFEPQEVYHFQNLRLWATLAKCHIKTGRTHQIRVHAKYIGMPVLGDELYGNIPSKALSRKVKATRQLLHAASLTLNHPKTGKEFTFQADLPTDFQEALRLCRELKVDEKIVT